MVTAVSLTIFLKKDLKNVIHFYLSSIGVGTKVYYMIFCTVTVCLKMPYTSRQNKTHMFV